MPTRILNERHTNTIMAQDDELEIRNVAIEGRLNNDRAGIFAAVQNPDGAGIISNCYLGDGGGGRMQGIFSHPQHHRGHLIIENCYFAGWGNNAIYAETGTPHGRGGTVEVRDCVFENNNIAHVRISAGSVDTVYVRNSGSVPVNHSNAVNSRGLHSFYGTTGSVDATNCHINVTSSNTNGSAHAIRIRDRGPTWNVTDSEIQGPVSGNVNVSSSGSDPDFTYDPVPTSVDAAVSGTSGGGIPEGGGGDTGSGDDSVTGGSGAPSFETVDVGFDDIPENLEPPASKITVNAYVTDDKLQELNALRDRDEPFDISVGQFTRADVGLTDITWVYDGKKSAHDVTLTLQEHREVYVTSPDLSGGEDSEESDSEDEDASDYIEDEDQFDEVPDPETDNTVNLGDEGLEEGDEIDSYLEDNVAPGTRVEIPAGTYAWGGGGLDGDYENTEITGVAPGETDGEEEEDGDAETDGGMDIDVDAQAHDAHVTLEMASGASTPHIRVTGGGAGSVHLENIIFTGERASNTALELSVQDQNASALIRRVWFPDGSNTGSASGIRIGDAHTGSVYLRNCSAENFANGGVLARNARGRVIVEGGLYRNNNVADIALAGNDSKVELATIVNDESAPGYQDSGGGRQRGVWFAGDGTGMRVINSDFYHAIDSAPAIQADDGPSMNGTVRNTRITNDSEQPPAIIRNDITFDGVHITGSGNTTLRGAEAACVGDNCDEADYTFDRAEAEVETEEEVLEAGETRTITVGDNETLSGKIYDQSAQGARVEIIPDGQSWTVENIAIIGLPSGGSSRALIRPTVAAGSTATIRNVYMPDGARADSGITGIRVQDASAGALTIRDSNIQRFPDYGIHAHLPGGSGGDDGDTTVDNCYLAHNGEANVSLGTNGSELKNSVVYTDGTGPTSTGEYRGVWGWYEDVYVTNCDVFVSNSAGPAVVGGRHGGSVTMTSGNLRGDTDGDVNIVNVGDDPSSAIPSGVPDSPTQAAGQ